MKDYGIDVFAQCIGGKVVFVRKPLVFKDDRKPFVDRDKILNGEKVGMTCLAVLRDAPACCYSPILDVLKYFH